MASDPGAPYRVERLPRVDAQIRACAQQARTAGIRPQYLHALKESIRMLETQALQWGDPEYHTRHPGGIVYHAVFPPVFIHYVAYEQERKVCILDVKLLGPPPADQD
jgi:hypothetical protein